MPVIVLNCCRLFGWSRFVFGQISAEIVAERMKQEGRMRGEGNRNARCQISSFILLACFAKLMLIGLFQEEAKTTKCGVECVNLSDDCVVETGNGVLTPRCRIRVPKYEVTAVYINTHARKVAPLGTRDTSKQSAEL